MLITQTCESVSPGHPDKVADYIADSILDQLLIKDTQARAAIEVVIKSGLIVITGEISTNCWCDIETITRECLRDIGYNGKHIGICANTCAIIQNIGHQSPDIADGIKNLGAGDQGFMVGYACDETPEHMPYGMLCAHSMMQKHAYLLKNTKDCPLGPDAKCQVSINYHKKNKPRLDSVILSSQHVEDISYQDLKNYILNNIIYQALPSSLVCLNTVFIINPAGRFVIGGPAADCGLTGRKLMVDTYGSYARHGGGAFSGKDPSKVDRAGAYAARYIANHLVTSGLFSECEVHIGYAIGRADPVAITVFGEEKVQLVMQTLITFLIENFPVRPADIIKTFDLHQPIYASLSHFGHFGRKDLDLPWDRIDESLIESINKKFR